MSVYHPGSIYFAAPVGGGRIKIGFSQWPGRRVVLLSRYSPVKLEVLAAVEGHARQERALHYHFRDSHSHAEWFDPCPALLALIATVKCTGQLPQLDAAPRKDIARWRSSTFVRRGKWPDQQVAQ